MSRIKITFTFFLLTSPLFSRFYRTGTGATCQTRRSVDDEFMIPLVESVKSNPLTDTPVVHLGDSFSISKMESDCFTNRLYQLRSVWVLIGHK